MGRCRLGEVFRAQFAASPMAAIEWMQTLPGEVRAVYEAGPTGFGLARAARAAGLEVMVCWPGAIPRQPGDQVKTDARDALKLARLHAAGQLRAVLVPALEVEALRDLVRGPRGAAGRADERAPPESPSCCCATCLRRARREWSTRHLRWLSGPLRRGVDRNAVRRISRSPRSPARASRAAGPANGRALCSGSVGADRGPVTVSARHRHPDGGRTRRRDRRHQRLRTSQASGQLSRPGPSEHSSQTKRRQGAITKAGSSHARRLLIEAASALPAPAQGVTDPQTPPRRPIPRRHRRGLARAEPPASPLDELDHSRGKRHAIVAVAVARNSPALSGRSPANRTDPGHDQPVPGGGGGRRSVTGPAIQL